MILVHNVWYCIILLLRHCQKYILLFNLLCKCCIRFLNNTLRAAIKTHYCWSTYVRGLVYFSSTIVYFKFPWENKFSWKQNFLLLLFFVCFSTLKCCLNFNNFNFSTPTAQLMQPLVGTPASEKRTKVSSLPTNELIKKFNFDGFLIVVVVIFVH